MSIDTVTEGKIRSYACAMDSDALSNDELKAIAYDYMNKVMRGGNVIPAWPKETKLLMASMGIAQDKTTGFPERYDGSVTAWKLNYEMEKNRADGAVASLKALVLIVRKAINTASEKVYDTYVHDNVNEAVASLEKHIEPIEFMRDYS